MMNAVPPTGEPDADRRLVLRCLGLALASGAGAALLSSFGTPAAAADMPAKPVWPKDAFTCKDEASALKALGWEAPVASDKITLVLPEIAENGAVVPVSISVAMPDVRSIAVMIPDNPFTLTALYPLPAGTAPDIACRVKMAKTAKVVALVAAGGKLYSATRDVKVTLGGCG